MKMSDRDGNKRFFEGTHRVCDPEATLAAVMPLTPAFGITRVAVLTGLDELGIPVAAAVRPNSRSIAVHQGKGVTLAAAKASAVMEAVECFHAETVDLTKRVCSFRALSETVEAADPATLPRSRGRSYAGEHITWVEGQDLLSGRPLWLPAELVTADYTAPQPADAGLFQASTNGLASGNHRLEAVLHALYEVIERDAIALWRVLPEAAQDARALDLSLVDGPLGRKMLRLIAEGGHHLRLWDVTSDLRLPAFVCLLASPIASDAVEPELGFGCHADRDVAVVRAITEAAQARLTRISGARDDFDPQSYEPSARATRQEVAARWLSTPAVGAFRSPASYATPTLQGDLEAVLGFLQAAGIERVGCVDLTRPEFAIPVVRVVVPGLEGPWTPSGGEYGPGPRARAAA